MLAMYTTLGLQSFMDVLASEKIVEGLDRIMSFTSPFAPVDDPNAVWTFLPWLGPDHDINPDVPILLGQTDRGSWAQVLSQDAALKAVVDRQRRSMLEADSSGLGKVQFQDPTAAEEPSATSDVATAIDDQLSAMSKELDRYEMAPNDVSDDSSDGT